MAAMIDPLFILAGRAVSPADLALGAGGLLLVILLLLVLVAWHNGRARAAAEAAAAERAHELEARLAELARAHGEMTGRMRTMAEVFGSRQSDLVRSLSERLDNVSHKLGQSLSDTQQNTHENLSRLHERLGVIDTAQRNITQLAGQVVELQAILSNKQTRGTFGQGRMEVIIADGLPKGAYSFQATLSNGKRPDCLVHMPNGAPDLAIDAKFPLEAYNALRAAETPEAEKTAVAQLRQDMNKHIGDIAERYLIKGETQDLAFMFVPSESVFAELNERFEDVVQRAHRQRVVIVSPSLLMLSIQVIQAVMRDQRMREQAHLIQGEVVRLMDDVNRLSDRVTKLQTHFGQANRDVEQILISTDKVARRGAKIEALEFGENGASGDASAADVVPLPSRSEAGE